jgi:hypothetical protein
VFAWQSREVVRRVAIACVLALVLVACGGGHGRAHASATTTTKKPAAKHAAVAIAPLTGLPDPGGVAGRRCVVTVKIDNAQGLGFPHWGLEQADVVYEEVVEGEITRLAAIFNSQAPDRVGPVRSVRRTDQSIVWPLRGIFAYSGGAAYAIHSIDTAPVTQLDETRSGSMMFRDHTRNPPHNLYAHVDQMYSRCASPAPKPLFSYRPAHVPSTGTPVSAVVVGFHGGYAVTWHWDPVSHTWKRSIFGAREVSATGTPISTANVVVMQVAYAGGVGVEGAEATLTGSGHAYVFSDGKETQGTWTRPSLTQAASLTDALGRPILLTPGQTWVELPDVSYAVTVTPAAPAATTAP